MQMAVISVENKMREQYLQLNFYNRNQEMYFKASSTIFPSQRAGR